MRTHLLDGRLLPVNPRSEFDLRAKVEVEGTVSKVVGEARTPGSTWT